MTDDDDRRKEQLLGEIADVHDAYVELMNERLGEVGRRELELYFTIVGKLVARLEDRDKSIRQSAQEVFAEVAALVMAELRR